MTQAQARPSYCDLPDWQTLADEIHCPMCGYNLRGLAQPRCPECGHEFLWRDLLDPTRRRHPYLFEHHPDHNLRSFVEHSHPESDAKADEHRLITFVSNRIERLFVAPMNMNYHAAHHLWVGIPEEFRQRVLANVWCGKCAAGTRIVNFRGVIEGGDLIRGFCSRCGAEVARHIESS